MSEAAEELKEYFRGSDELLEIVLYTNPAAMKLFVEAKPLAPERASEIKESHITALLEPQLHAAKINSRVISDAAALLAKGEPVSRRRIAKGSEPVPGKDGKFVLLVKPFEGFAKRSGADYVDARFFRHFDNIESGKAVMRIYPPKPGKAGEDVFGKRVEPAEGNPAAIKFDDSLRLKAASGSEHFDNLLANNDGCLIRDGDTWKVSETLTVDGDVDLQVGDIDFIGSVVVKGNVGKGFTIHARDDIEINGSVFAASLQTDTGSIVVNGEVSGGAADAVTATASASSIVLGTDHAKQPTIRSANQFRAHTVHLALISSRQTVTVEKEVRNCTIRTGGSIVVENGHLLGGDCYAVCGVEANFIGTEAGARTQIRLCSNVESSGEYAELATALSSHEHAAQMLRLHLGPYGSATEEERATLGSDHALRIEMLQKKLAGVEKSYKVLLQKRAALLKDAKFNSTMRVNFHKKLFSGTIVQAGEDSFSVNEDVDGPKSLEFNSETHEFRITDLSALECDFDEQEVT